MFVRYRQFLLTWFFTESSANEEQFIMYKGIWLANLGQLVPVSRSVTYALVA